MCIDEMVNGKVDIQSYLYQNLNIVNKTSTVSALL